MKKWFGLSSAFLLALSVLGQASGGAYASSGDFSAAVVFTAPFPLAFGNRSASVNFGMTFSSIEKVCFEWFTGTNPLGDGESILFGFGVLPRVHGPASSACFSTAEYPGAEAALLDGQQAFFVGTCCSPFNMDLVSPGLIITVTGVRSNGDATPPEITPSIAGSLRENGWYTSDATVSWVVVDPESPVTSTTGCGPALINADTPGITLTCSATSGGGTSFESVSVKRDATPPTITGSASPASNPAGWNNSDVTVSFECEDNLSGVANCPSPTIQSKEGQDQSVVGVAVDYAGNEAQAVVSGINIDKTLPTITASVSPAPNPAGWNNSDVNVSFECEDKLSGVITCGPDVVLAAEGQDQSASGEAADRAGNPAGLTVDGINIDLTPPHVSVTGVEDGAVYFLGSVPEPGCDTQDTLSGVAASAELTLTGGNEAGVGSFHALCDAALDAAGNPGSASAGYRVIYPFSGFLNPVSGPPALNLINAGAASPMKFGLGGDFGLDIIMPGYPISIQIHCDSSAPLNTVEETLTAGGSSLSYDPTTGEYKYIWKTNKVWAGTCRQFQIKLNDGAIYVANFKFK